MKNIKSLVLLVIGLLASVSCSEDFLDEKPLDGLTTANAFETAQDFDASVNNLYRLLRAELFTSNDNDPFEYHYRTDMGTQVTAGSNPNLLADYSQINGYTLKHWTAWYKIVSESNTIISRIPASQLSDANKLLFEAKARFFRGYAYRSLAHLYGGVPLIVEEVTAPKVDYVRATRKEIYTQCIADFDFAATNLPKIATAKDGEITDLAAQHMLAEVYIADGQFQKAVDAATIVISDPATDLMTARFGARKTEVPGDVYWDLFRRGNQNRKSGNTEGILVIQIETDIPGGAASSGVGFASGDLYSLERVHPGLVRDVVYNGTPVFKWPAADYSSGGRGVGFYAPTAYFLDLYNSDFNNDIRNANHNLVRKFKVTNPTSTLYNGGAGEIDFANLPAGIKGFNSATLVSGDPNQRALYPYQTKATEPFNPPTNLLDPAKAFPYQLKSGAGATYRDEYLIRLADTYLLRAEAYLGLANTTAAAADINVVRSRAGAAAVLPANVDIEYILDERMREFGVEEIRMFTLMRLGKWYSRIQKCNPIYKNNALPTYDLWPIPQSEIERNRGAVLEQNPDYN
jgi:hypothetical protein